jgi:hypothetical protein
MQKEHALSFWLFYRKINSRPERTQPDVTLAPPKRSFQRGMTSLL